MNSAQYKPVAPWFWINTSALDKITMQCPEPGSAMLLYMALQRIACREKDSRITGKSVSYLAQVSCLSIRTVRYRLLDLERIGLLTIQRQQITTPNGQVRNLESGYSLVALPTATVAQPPTATIAYPTATEFENRCSLPIDGEEKKKDADAIMGKNPSGNPSRLKAMLHQQLIGQIKPMEVNHE